MASFLMKPFQLASLLLVVFLFFVRFSYSAGTTVVRVVAVGNRQNVSNSASYETYANQFLSNPNITTARGDTSSPGLIVFGENVGLITAFLGTRGEKARQSSTSTEAFEILMLHYAEQMLAYEVMFHKLASTPLNLLELAMTDVMWRAFNSTFSQVARQLNSYVVAATVGPTIRESTNELEIKLFGDPDVPDLKSVYMADSYEVYNNAYLFNPQGEIIGRTQKHHLTAQEVSLLHLTPGNIDDNLMFETEIGNLCIAICWDGFFSDVITHLDSQGCNVLLQPSYNDAVWPANNSAIDWQPEDWTQAPLGALQDGFTTNLQYVVNPMITGNLFELPVDGQSIITRRSSNLPTSQYIGLRIPEVYPRNYTADVLALAPWVMEDPVDLPLEERRNLLREKGQELLQGGSDADGYVSSVIYADIQVPVVNSQQRRK